MKWIEHNATLIVGIILCVLLIVYAMACDAAAPSIMERGKRVTAVQLQLEVKEIQQEHELMLARADASFAEIQRENEFRKRVLEFAVLTAETGTFNPTGVIGLAGWILGGASYLNGRKKDTIIARDKTLLKEGAS